MHRSHDAPWSGRDLFDHRFVASFDLPGTLRRLRRVADLSQRELALALHVSKSSVAAAESGASGMDARVLARAVELSGLRLALLDAHGCEVSAMSADVVRDLGGRLFPAHLDTVHTDDLRGRYDDRLDRPRPSYAAGRDRAGRNARRRSHGTPEDHHPYRPGDSPAERAAARRRAAQLRRREEVQRRFESGGLGPVEDFDCTCPPRCEELDDRSGAPVHAEECPCLCDVA